MAKLRETIAELEAILGRRRQAARRHQGPSWARSARSSPTDRRSQITFDTGDIDIEDLIDDEDLVVMMSAKGYVKTMAADAFRTQGRGGRGVAGAKLRDEDYVTHIIHTTAHAYLLFFSNRGRVYRLKAHEIPMKERTARGTADRQPAAAAAGRDASRRSSTPATTRPTGTCSSPRSKGR